MSKGEKDSQRARERIAQARAAQARRKLRRTWVTGIAALAAAALAAVAITLIVTSGSGAGPSSKLAALSTLGPLKPAPPAGPAGPEGIPVPAAAALAGTASAASGLPVDGIRCQTSEQTIFHIHAHLTILVNGSPRQVPAGIGIPEARAQNTAQGPFIASGKCFYWLHTHAADGIIHIESPVQRTYTLGNFFDEWGQPLGPRQVGSARGQVVAIYNGKRYEGDPRDIPLNKHAQIQLEVGTPLTAQQRINFPGTL